jgi:hypothetical protein
MDPREVTGEYVEGPTTKMQSYKLGQILRTLGLNIPCIGHWEIIISGHVVQRISSGRTPAV